LISKALLDNFSSEQIKIDEPMKNHTSFRIGGTADYFVTPYNSEQVKNVIDICRSYKMPYYIVGNGSNILVKDKGFRGVIIHLGKLMSEYSVKENRITAQAGILLSKLAAAALKNELSGLEFAAGIPGTLGGAVCMNAGAYSGEMKQILVNAQVIDSEGNFQVLEVAKLDLGYRRSIISEKNLIVTEAEILLNKGEYEKIKSYMQELSRQRKEKQPLEFASAGSTFKRPEGNFAGKLIMEAGLRGYAIGGAEVSKKHCGFLINTGGATAAQMLELIEYVQKKVNEEFGVLLEPEVKIIGE